MSLILTSKSGGDFTPHPEGIHPAVCVDVMDLGLQEVEYQGRRKMVQQVRIVFESELTGLDGVRFTVDKRFTASLHVKARLADFVGKWRGRPIVDGEQFDLGKLIGACCTLVISHQKNMVGRTYASIDAVSKPTKKVTPSGAYDPAAARARWAEWQAKQNGGARVAAPTAPAPAAAGRPFPERQGPAPAPAAAAKPDDFDPEVGF